MSEAALRAEAILGQDAEAFMKTDLYRFMVARADAEEAEAAESLAAVSPWRRRRIQDLQARIWRARSFRGWLDELVVIGDQALQQLEAAED